MLCNQCSILCALYLGGPLDSTPRTDGPLPWATRSIAIIPLLVIVTSQVSPTPQRPSNSPFDEFFLRAALVFCPVLVKDAFQGDASAFSVAISAFGVGGLLGAMGLLAIDPSGDRRRLTSCFAMGYAVVMALAALIPWLWGLPALLALAGLSMSVSNTSANSYLQAMSSPQLRGQTISLFMLAMRGGVSAGSFLTEVSANILGVRYALLINGILAVAGHVIVGRQWLRLPRQKPVE
jgi:predicted MFS family arabinose efflux permease